MKKYNVTVNGVVYEVEVEEVEATETVETPVATPAPAVKKAAPAPKAAPAKPAAKGTTGALKIVAPMGGTVTKVLVKVGDAVKSGDTLLTFEAMKMEQEIKSPKDGVVASVNISAGAAMTQDTLLVSLN